MCVCVCFFFPFFLTDFLPPQFYFSPGDSPPTVWTLSSGLRVGVGICWDQWFPELARSLVLLGADCLVYPTAIGSEPDGDAREGSSRGQWMRCMQGHAASNIVNVIAANRSGREVVNSGERSESEIEFYGGSFATDTTGGIVEEAGGGKARVSVVVVDGRGREERMRWGIFRDRRPECYGVVATKDGGV